MRDGLFAWRQRLEACRRDAEREPAGAGAELADALRDLDQVLRRLDGILHAERWGYHPPRT